MMLRLLAVFAALFFVVGCAHQMPVTPPPNVLEHQQKLQAISAWQVTGKLGIRTSEESGSASLTWAQHDQDFRINLSGPLGQKHMIITGKPGNVSLEESGQPPLTAKTAEALIKKAAGWTLPVTELAYWVRGVPAPKQDIARLQQNDMGLIAQLEQGGWTITYNNYRDWQIQGATLPLPQKITAEYRDIRLILVIRAWQLGAAQ